MSTTRHEIAYTEEVSEKLRKISKNDDMLYFIANICCYSLYIYQLNKEKNLVLWIPEIDKETGNLLRLSIEIDSKLTVKEYLLYIRSRVLECYSYNSNIGRQITSQKNNYIISYECLHKNVEAANTGNYMYYRILAKDMKDKAVLYKGGNYYSSFIYEDFGDTFMSLCNALLNNINNTLEQFDICSKEETGGFRKGLTGNISYEYKTFDICESIRKWGQKMPDRVALSIDNVNYTYKNLWDRILEIAGKINTYNTNIIAIWGKYNFDMIAATFAVLAVKKTYFPIDCNMPYNRLKKALNGLGCKVILGYDGQPIDGVEAALLDSCSSKEASFEYNSSIDKEAVAYIMFSSGTTGEPKAIPVKYSSLANYICWKRDTYHYDEKAVSLQVLSYNFDAFGSNLYPVLMFGGKMVMPGMKEQKNIPGLLELIKGEDVNEFNVVPSLYMRLLNSSKGDELGKVKRVILGGESSSHELVKISNERYPSIELINEYGPTEAAITISFKRSMAKENPNCIGSIIDNNTAFVINAEEKILPPGVPGELCVCGASVMNGYLNESLDESFIMLDDNRAYKTGDIVRYSKTGELEYIGRKNNQVSLNGYRVDIEEIEKYLVKSGVLIDSAVVIRDDRYGNKYLCAFVCIKESGYFNIDDIVGYMKENLPEYMIPKQYVRLDELPKNINGKTDRSMLMEMPIEEKDILTKKSVQPKTDTEVRLLAIWRDLLGIEKISCIDNFFDIGGNSLLVMEMQGKVLEIFNINLPITEFFNFYTIFELGKRIDVEINKGGDICEKGK